VIIVGAVLIQQFRVTTRRRPRSAEPPGSAPQSTGSDPQPTGAAQPAEGT
jgi:hypothetical protein